MDSKQVFHVKNNEGKYIQIYRDVMEKHLGRKLSTNEVVHHINGDHFDNRIENLKVMSRKEHSILHNSKLEKKSKANYTFDKDVKKEFDLLCKDKSINKSALLEKWIKKFIDENKKS